jgi:mRNA degradation ribonuclease J1/J2
LLKCNLKEEGKVNQKVFMDLGTTLTSLLGYFIHKRRRALTAYLSTVVHACSSSTQEDCLSLEVQGQLRNTVRPYLFKKKKKAYIIEVVNKPTNNFLSYFHQMLSQAPGSPSVPHPAHWAFAD